MSDWAQRSNRFHDNLLALGDLNIDRDGSPLYDAFVSKGLTIPDFLVDLPRTVFDDPGDSPDDNFLRSDRVFRVWAPVSHRHRSSERRQFQFSSTRVHEHELSP